MKVHTLVMSKARFQSMPEALAWVRRYRFAVRRVSETMDAFHVGQREPSRFRARSLRTVHMVDGVAAVIGELR